MEEVHFFEDLGIRVYRDGKVEKLVNGKWVEATRYIHDTGSGIEYAFISKMMNGVQKHFYVHRLVADAFVPKPEGLDHPVVRHKNGDQTDCRAENLEWVGQGIYKEVYSVCPVCGKKMRRLAKMCGHCKALKKQHEESIRKQERIRKEKTKEWLKRIPEEKRKLMTSREQEYLDLLLEGMSFQQVGKRFGISRQAVHFALMRASDRTHGDLGIIKNKLLEMGLKYKDLKVMTGLSGRTIKNVEEGRGRIDSARKICKALDLDISEVLS